MDGDPSATIRAHPHTMDLTEYHRVRLELNHSSCSMLSLSSVPGSSLGVVTEVGVEREPNSRLTSSRIALKIQTLVTFWKLHPSRPWAKIVDTNGPVFQRLVSAFVVDVEVHTTTSIGHVITSETGSSAIFISNNTGVSERSMT